MAETPSNSLPQPRIKKEYRDQLGDTLVSERRCNDQDEFDLRRIFAVLRAHILPFLITVAIVLGIGVYLAKTIKPRFESTAILNVEDRTSLINEDLMLTNEIKVLTRDATILSTIPLAIRVLQGLKRENLGKGGRKAGNKGVSSEQVKRFLKNLRIEQAPGASVIKVSYRASDPKQAARVVNRIVDEFKRFKAELLSRRFDAEKQSVNDEVQRLRHVVKKAETAVARYKRAHNLADDIGLSMKIRQVGELDTQLTLARSELADAEIRWRRVAALQRAGNAEALGSVMGSTLVHTLREEESAMLAHIAQLQKEYGSAHPKLVDARAKLQSLQKSIQKELKYIADRVKGEVTARQRKVSLLRDNINRLEAEVTRGQEATIKLKDLQRDVDSSRRVLEKFLIAEKQHGISAANRTALEDPVTVLARGFIPSDAVFPKPGQIMLLAVMAATILGLMAAFFAEHLYPRVTMGGYRRVALQEPSVPSATRHREERPNPVVPVTERRKPEAKSISGLRNLIIPIPGDGMSIVPATEAVAKKGSGFSQAILRLGEAVVGSELEAAEVLLVTSVNRRGDKVSVASGLAALLTEQNRKTIVVDLSLGDSEVQHAFDLDASPGMSDVLHNELPLLKAIQTDIRTHVSFFARGEGLRSDENNQLIMAAPALINLLKRYFNVVIVVAEDVTPAVDEIRFYQLARVVDHVIAVVEENGAHHGKLMALLFNTVFSRVKNKVIPVLVHRLQ